MYITENGTTNSIRALNNNHGNLFWRSSLEEGIAAWFQDEFGQMYLPEHRLREERKKNYRTDSNHLAKVIILTALVLTVLNPAVKI